MEVLNRKVAFTYKGVYYEKEITSVEHIYWDSWVGDLGWSDDNKTAFCLHADLDADKKPTLTGLAVQVDGPEREYLIIRDVELVRGKDEPRDINGYYQGIINPYNGHDRKLVDTICDAWDEDFTRFKGILFAFCIRDEQEIRDKFNDYCPETPEDALDFAHEIMENVCDDMDLECILKFLRKDNPEEDINITWKKPGKAFVFINTSDYPGDVGVIVSDLTEDPNSYGLSEEEANEISALSVGESTSNFDYPGCIAVRIQ